jgi:hypothetical protein
MKKACTKYYVKVLNPFKTKGFMVFQQTLTKPIYLKLNALLLN